MRTFQVTVTNDDFIATSEVEAADKSAAVCQAVKGALAVGSEQILAGKAFFAAELAVVDGDARQRFIVSLGVSSLK